MMQEAGNLAAKLLGLFERQFTALTKARKPPPVVTVEHVHRHLHVTTPGPTGEEIRIEGQPHATIDARTLALAPGPALLGQDPPRDTLPITCDKARTMPRMHGGAPGTGAPSGKRNGSWKHGRFSREHVELRRAIRALMHEARATLATVLSGKP
jgi:hypothetical protein